MKCKNLTFADRKRLEELRNENKSLSAIADELGVHLATIYREISRGNTGEIDDNGQYRYSAAVAQANIRENLSRRGRCKTTTA